MKNTTEMSNAKNTSETTKRIALVAISLVILATIALNVLSYMYS